jgi:hypothetical protein
MVRTLGGRLVAAGTVGVATAAGYMVREGGQAHWYAANLYVCEAAEPPVGDAAPGDGDAPDGADAADARLGAPVRGDGAVRRRGAVADADRLPADIQRAIRRDVQLSGDQIDAVLGEVGKAALSGLRRVGVPEGSLHGVVAHVQGAVRDALVKLAVAR